MKSNMTKIELNFKVLKDNNLSPNEFVYLNAIFNGLEVFFPWGTSDLSILEKKGFIGLKNDEILVTKKTIDLFIKKLPKKEQAKSEELYEFVEKYRELFPSIKSGERQVKSDSYGCITKFKSFFKKYKFSQDQVLEATKQYVSLKKKVNYDKMTCADYFIEKNGGSMLASYCENLNKTNINNNGKSEQSGDI